MAQVILNIDNDEQFNDIINKGIEALNPDDIKDIIITRLQTLLTEDPSILKSLLIKPKNYYDSETKPTEFALNILKQADYSQVQDIADNIIAILKSELMNIVKSIVLQCILSGMSNMGDFYSRVSELMKDAIVKHDVEIKTSLSEKGIII